jgi:hypothetical protein
MQISPQGGARPVAASPARPRVTRTALLASAKLITVNKTTTAGATLTLAEPQSLGQDCSPLGQVIVKVTTPPDHGSVHITPATTFSNYVPGDAPYLCNARKTPATLVSYQATAGFTGSDVAVIQIFFPDGRAPLIRFNITVS